MKGFFKWFKNEARMKRWMLVIILGMVLASTGISKVIVSKVISFQGVAKVAALFVAGFTLVIIGLVYAQKRVLEILIENTDSRMENSDERNIKSLIFNKKVYHEGPKIVAIGGGTGLNTVLRGLKKYTNNVTAIATVSAYGKEQTESRKKLGLLPIDDIKDSMISLANNEEEMAKILNTELQARSLKGLTFGDIFFASMKEQYGNFSEAVEKSKDVLNIVGRVLPVTLDEMKICAELNDGTIVEEKDKIAETVFEKIAKIERIYINPSNCVPAPGVLETIKEADAIIIGPGSLYTNVIPNLLIKGVSKAIKESKAIKIYVSNIMTEPGQTDNYSLSDHIQAIIDHSGGNIIDYCIYDSGEIVPEYIRQYNKKGADVVEQDITKAKALGIKLLEKDLSQIVGDVVRHNTEVVAESVIELVCDDMKFKNQQNDPKYVMLNAKLREDKAKIRREKKAKKTAKKPEKAKEKQERKHVKRMSSKFSTKYRDRIKSIQESDSKREQNIKLEKAKQKRLKQEQKEKSEFLKQVENESKTKNKNKKLK